MTRRRPAKLAHDRRDREVGWSSWALADDDDARGPDGQQGVAAIVVCRAGLGAVDAGPARPGRHRAAGPAAHRVWLPATDCDIEPGQPYLGDGGSERGHSRCGGGQPPPPPSGWLAGGRPWAGPGRRRAGVLVHPVWAGRPAGGGACRRLPGRVRQRHGLPLPLPGRVGPPAHPHREAALAPLALVGQAPAGRGGAGLPHRGRGTDAAVPRVPRNRQPLGVAALASGPLAAAFPVGALLILAGLPVGAVSLLLRFRRARGQERLQLRWLAVGAALAAVALAVSLTALVVEDTDGVVFQAALGVCVMALPLATGAAILRYRLYDLDRIISRTLAYGLLTVLLGGGYAAVVLGLGQLLGPDSSLVVAAATLAVAAVFQPARRRVQQVVDQRFNRRRHDAARIIEGFGTRLRDQVDLATLTGELLAAVDQTMQPTRASLWLRSQEAATATDGTTAHR